MTNMAEVILTLFANSVKWLSERLWGWYKKRVSVEVSIGVVSDGNPKGGVPSKFGYMRPRVTVKNTGWEEIPEYGVKLWWVTAFGNHSVYLTPTHVSARQPGDEDTFEFFFPDDPIVTKMAGKPMEMILERKNSNQVLWKHKGKGQELSSLLARHITNYQASLV